MTGCTKVFATSPLATRPRCKPFGGVQRVGRGEDVVWQRVKLVQGSGKYSVYDQENSTPRALLMNRVMWSATSSQKHCKQNGADIGEDMVSTVEREGCQHSLLTIGHKRGQLVLMECLNAHNEYRARHGSPPLTLNNNLCRFADEWARNLAARGQMFHRQNSPYGENIYMSYGMVVTGKSAVDSWYSEIKSHVFGREPTSMGTGHFTQVVWKDSRQLGVGMATNAAGQTYVVANYDPPGNYIGRYAQQVPPLQR
uniref:SCP domain-containing protein n=1 Tax=Lutzomyia longipalpis TaxID=7200 RepID=A0A1B0CTI2_LUTLO